MNLTQRLMILGALAAAGCSSSPDYEPPKKRDRPVIEDKVEAPVKIETPIKVEPSKDTTTPKLPEDAPKPAYQAVTFEVVYEADSKHVAAVVRGSAKLTGKTDYQAAQETDANKNGKLSSVEISDRLEAVRKEKGLAVLDVPYVKDGSDIKYVVTLDIPTAEVDAIKSRFTGNAYNKAELVKAFEGAYKKHVDK